MTIAKQIENARKLKSNPSAYARAMSGAIRAAMSARALKAFRDAVEADGMVGHFANWASDCPTAA